MDDFRERPEIRISPEGFPVRNLFRDVAAYRELFVAFFIRDVRLRYKQTLVGVLWVALQPLCFITIFTFLMTRAGAVPTNGMPYFIYALAAYVPWQVFSKGLGEGSNCLVTSSSLISKIYFPKVLLPIATVCGGLIDAAVTLVILLVMMLVYGVVPEPGFALAVLAILPAVLAAVGATLWLAPMNVIFRDVRIVMPFLSQIWMFLTPVFYPLTMVPEKLHWFYALNPMVFPVEVFRWAALGTPLVDWRLLLLSASVLAAIFAGGLVFFRKLESRMVDYI